MTDKLPVKIQSLYGEGKLTYEEKLEILESVKLKKELQHYVDTRTLTSVPINDIQQLLAGKKP